MSTVTGFEINRYYVDLTITWEHAFKQENLDLRLGLKNLFDDRRHVGGQWVSGQYRPRGISAEITAFWRF